MRLYAYLGRSLAAEGAARSSNPYREWIETYASPDFESLATTLEGLLNRYAHDTPMVSGAYRRAMRLELGFFAAFLEE
jgi:thiaminase/transcriptional activator TenA